MGAEDYSKMTLISTHPVKKGDLGFHVRIDENNEALPISQKVRDKYNKSK